MNLITELIYGIRIAYYNYKIKSKSKITERKIAAARIGLALDGICSDTDSYREVLLDEGRALNPLFEIREIWPINNLISTRDELKSKLENLQNVD